MLGKLIKYEFKSLNRYMIPLHLGIIGATLLGKVFLLLNISNNLPNVFNLLLLSTYILILTASYIVTFVFIIRRFYKNLFTDEGYLMNTLPVKPWQHIAAKLTGSFVWQTVNLFLVLVSIFILIFPDFSTVNSFLSAYNEFKIIFADYTGSSFSLFVLGFILITIIGEITGMLIIYASIALGQLLSKHKVLGAFSVYFGLSIIKQTIYSAFSINSIFTTTTYTANYNPSVQEVFTESLVLVRNSMLCTTIISLLFAIAGFFAANYILNKKLNLD